MYKILRNIAWAHDQQEEAGHTSFAISAYEADRIVPLDGWPADLVDQLIADGAIELVVDEPPKPAEPAIEDEPTKPEWPTKKAKRS